MPSWSAGSLEQQWGASHLDKHALCIVGNISRGLYDLHDLLVALPVPEGHREGGGREREREGGREKGREEGREGGRERGKKGGREEGGRREGGGRERIITKVHIKLTLLTCSGG